MHVQKILTANATYQKFVVLKTNRNKRYKHGEFLVEGVRNINQAVENQWHICSFLYAGERRLSSWATTLLAQVATDINYDLAGALMTELSSKEDTSELLAVVRMRSEAEPFALSGNPLIVLFDRPSNKGNLGTMLRSCDAFGVDGLILTGHAVDIYEPDVISSSMGSFFHVPFMRLSDNADIDAYVERLRTAYPGLMVIGTTAHRQTRLQDLALGGPVLFLVGNETGGLNQHLTECCDVMATIPMSQASTATSFNVSCAATVMLYEANRQRNL